MYRVIVENESGIWNLISVRTIFNGLKTYLTSEQGFELEVTTKDIISIEQI